MSSEDDGGVSFTLPGEVHDWLAREAGRRGERPDDRCQRLVTAAHAVATADDLEPADLEDVADLRSQLEAQREEFADLLEDVRARVVQVKREADAKAPADHDGYASDDDLEALRADLESLKATVDDGFENFESVLEHLLEETGTLSERSTLLATAVVDLRERRRGEADRLRLAANRLGVRTAVCDGCDGRVDVALLSEPECPHCASEFADVEAKSSIFGSHALVTGEPPALEGRIAPPESSADAVDAADAADLFGAVEAETTPRSEPDDETTASSEESTTTADHRTERSSR